MNLIIAAHSGTGKSTLCKMYPNLFTDFTCAKYKYIVPNDFISTDDESLKASFLHEFRLHWQYDYVGAIMRSLGRKILVIPSERKVLELLEFEGIRYTLCYPERLAKDIYRQRYIDRGNNENFLEVFVDDWDRWIDCLEDTPADTRIVMQPQQYLSDVINIKEIVENNRRITRTFSNL